MKDEYKKAKKSLINFYLQIKSSRDNSVKKKHIKNRKKN
jgi:hypothetical protein